MKIRKVIGREILDSRGNPTVEVEVFTDEGIGRASAPSGASVGKFEAVELRDGGKRFAGRGVLRAVENVKKIAKAIIGMDVTKQKGIDEEIISLDGTKNKSKLGTNAMVATSMAVAKAAACSLSIPLYTYLGKLSNTSAHILPILQMNVINGGKHAGIENDIQEHLMMPIGAKSFHEALRISTETFYVLKEILKRKFSTYATLYGDEGGFVPPIKTVGERLEIISKAIEEAGYEKKIALAIDSAASEFYKNGRYVLGKKKYTSEELVDFYKDLVKTFKIVSIEDGMAEEDWEGWRMLTKELKIQIVGDDLLVTNMARIKEAIKKKAANSLILKVNQIGTVSEAIEAAKIAQKAGWKVVVAHRSGETEDTFIADLAVGLDAGQSKFGGPARSERTAKYNELLRIEEELGKKAKYGMIRWFVG